MSPVRCTVTRLRINCKDTSIVNLDAIKQLDVLGAQFTGEQLQVIIGNEVKEVYEAFIEQSGLQKEAMIERSWMMSRQRKVDDQRDADRHR
ncbi:MAG: hypothetical protein ACLVJ6_10150 [Merdibacter sp.]